MEYFINIIVAYYKIHETMQAIQEHQWETTDMDLLLDTSFIKLNSLLENNYCINCRGKLIESRVLNGMYFSPEVARLWHGSLQAAAE